MRKHSATTALQLDSNDLYAYLVRAQAMLLAGRSADATAERSKAETAINQLMAKKKKPPDMTIPLVIFVEDDSPEVIRLLEPAEKRLTALERMLLASAYFDIGKPEDGEAEFRKAFEDTKIIPLKLTLL